MIIMLHAKKGIVCLMWTWSRIILSESHLQFIGATMGTSELNIQTENGHIGMPSNVCCVVVEYCPGGALKSYLIKNRRKKLAFKVVIQLALDLARGSNSHAPSVLFFVLQVFLFELIYMPEFTYLRSFAFEITKAVYVHV